MKNLMNLQGKDRKIIYLKESNSMKYHKLKEGKGKI